jgi:hypothetical protein
LEILQLQKIFMDRFNLCIDPHTGEYILEQLQSGASEAIPVMGHDARTGVALREILPASELKKVIFL